MRIATITAAVAVLAAGCSQAPATQTARAGGHPDLVTLQSMLPSLKLGLSAGRVHELMGLPDDSPAAGQERYLSATSIDGRPVALTLTFEGGALQSFVLAPAAAPAPVAPAAPAPAPAASPAS